MTQFTANPAVRPAKNTLPLAWKLPGVMILLLILAFALSAYLNAQTTQAALVTTLQKELSNQTETKADLIRSNLILSRSLAVNLAAAAEVINFDERTIADTIQNMLRRDEQALGAAIAYEPSQYRQGIYYWAPYYSRNPDGSMNYVPLGNPQYNYFGKEWYALASALGHPVLSSPYQNENNDNQWVVTWSAPFYTQDGSALRGVATADIAFTGIESTVKNIQVGEGGYALLLDPQGVILGIGENGGYYQTMESSMLKLARASQAAQWEKVVSSMLTGTKGFTRATDLLGRPVLVAYTPIGLGTGWSLALVFPQEETQPQFTKARNAMIGYSILATVILGFFIYLFSLSLTQPLKKLTRQANEAAAHELRAVEGKVIQPIKIHTGDEIEELAEAYNRMAENVSSSFQILEEKVRLGTADLERSSLEFATIAEVARDITIIRDLSTLLNVSVNLIRERFSYYHVGIFLVDSRGEYAVLRAASSHAATQMLEQDYKLKVGQEGMVGTVTRTGRAHIALDVGTDAAHFQNPYLPDTHSEITLPLRSHSVTIGALDIQTTRQSAFNERDLKILQLLADQIAAAIDNAQLADQLAQSASQASKRYKLQTKRGWQADLERREITAYAYDGLEITPIPDSLPEPLRAQIQSGKPVLFRESAAPRGTKKTLLIPLRAQEQTIGVIGVEQQDANHAWSEEEIEIVTAAANRAALTLENARLLEESQRRAVKERAIFEATERIGSALNLDNILQITAEEIERALNSAEVILQFSSDKKV